MLELEIELLSPLCSGSGLNRPGVVDREVAFDAAGLPVIPGRRLKGLLRDGYQQILESGLPEMEALPSPDELFGRPGQRESGRLRVTNARLEDAEAIGEWLRAVEASEKMRNIVRPGEVLRTFTDIRRQTSMDAKTGAAREDTLRFTRTLRSGLKFRAALSGLDGLSEEAIALAAAAVQNMGLSRSRGLGEVSCRVLKQVDGHPTDLTTKTIGQLESTGFAASVPKPLPEAAAAVERNGEGPHCLLRFRLRLKDAAIFPSLATGDPNTVLTHTAVPGSVIRGVLAGRYLAGHGVGTAFGELFLKSQVLFLSANPLVDNTWRAQPTHHAVREYKDSSRHVDALAVKLIDEGTADERAVEDLDPMRQSRRLSPKWCRLDAIWDGATQPSTMVRTGMSYHNARAQDRRVGRAVGQESEDRKRYGLESGEGGALFVYEGVEAEQTFEGAILGSRESLDTLQALIANGEVVGLGRSKSAQYGGAARWEWMGEIQQSWGREAWNWGQSTRSEEAKPTDEIRVTLLSPLVGRNQWGHPAPCFPTAELEGALNAKVKLKKSAVRTNWQGGYLSHQLLPVQQTQVLSPGSVLIFELDRKVTAAERETAERRSYGGRIDEGFGRIAITVAPRPLGETELFKGAKTTTPAARQVKLNSGDAAWPIGLKLFRMAVDREATGLAYQQKILSTRMERVSPSLLYRVMAALEAGGVDGLPRWMGRLRATARTQLEGGRVCPSDGTEQTLADFLKAECADEPGQGWRRRAQRMSKSAAKKWEDVFDSGTNPMDVERDGKELVRHYLLRYLSALAGQKREQRRPKA